METATNIELDCAIIANNIYIYLNQASSVYGWHGHKYWQQGHMDKISYTAQNIDSMHVHVHYILYAVPVYNK